MRLWRRYRSQIVTGLWESARTTLIDVLEHANAGRLALIINSEARSRRWRALNPVGSIPARTRTCRKLPMDEPVLAPLRMIFFRPWRRWLARSPRPITSSRDPGGAAKAFYP